MTRAATSRTELGNVLISVPADPDYLPIIRSASAQVGAKLGGTLSEVSDLRLAVEEACVLLLQHTSRVPDGEDEDNLECRFVLGPATLRVALRVRADAFTRPEADGFGWTILTALVDDISWRADGSTVQVEILKRHGARG
jgi:serine/threonine-protein kinase RsbW